MKVILLFGILAWMAMCGHSLTPPRQCCNNGTFVNRGGCVKEDNTVMGPRLKMDCQIYLIEDIRITDEGMIADFLNNTFAVDIDQYCIGEMLPRNLSKGRGTTARTTVALVCFDYDSIKPSVTMQNFAILSLVSVVFFILTLWVYFYLPELRDLQGKCMMSQCVCMALAFFHLAVVQLDTASSNTILGNCISMSYSMYFWMMGMFFWLNVASINTFRSVIQATYLKKTESRQFVYYNVYAWGCSAALLLVTIITNEVEGSHHKPGFGHGRCWFEGPTETWLFFYGPVAVLISANIVLFVITSIKIWSSAKQYEVGTINSLKYKFSLYLNIFLVTGLSWVFEVASFAHGASSIVWDIADVFNTLQGVIIFLLLVLCRRRALLGLSERGVGGPPVRWLLARFKKDQENENIVEVENDPENFNSNEANFNVNLN